MKATISATVLAAAILSTSAADADSFVIANVASHHTIVDSYCDKDGCKAMNEQNRGLGLELEATKHLSSVVGFYNNSYHRIGVYVGVKAKYDIRLTDNATITPGVTLGGVTGYQEFTGLIVTPLVVPSIAAQYRRVKLEVGVIPDKNNPVITLQIGLAF